jgi:tetratricopeptide (TPR) repeat protein
MGSIQLAKNDPNQAINYFVNAIKQKPKDIIGYRALADLYARQKKFDEALTVTRAGLEQQPQSYSLHLALAGLLEVKKDYDAAIAEYEAMLKEQPGSMVIANNLASLLSNYRTDKASLDRADALAAVLTKSPIPQFKDTLGWIDYQRANYEAATALLEGAVAELPDDPSVNYHLGMLYLATGQDAKASEKLKKALELAPNDADLKTKIDSALKSHSAKEKG